MPPTKKSLLADLKKAQANLDALNAQIEKTASIRDQAMWQAKHLAGVTYAEIQAVTGLSAARITQVLRRNRPADD